MKILFLNTNIGYGGASKQMVWVANQCAMNGHDVTFYTYRDSAVNQKLYDTVKHVVVEKVLQKPYIICIGLSKTRSLM